MEKVTIQEASLRLNVSQRTIRESIHSGELQAHREAGPWGQRWVVELPEDGWVESFKASLTDLASSITPWWWSTEAKVGFVHYVKDLGIEEIEPVYLCGLKGDNVWDAKGHTREQRCLDCLQEAQMQGLPLWSDS